MPKWDKWLDDDAEQEPFEKIKKQKKFDDEDEKVVKPKKIEKEKHRESQDPYGKL